jgi:hypothetical protein
MKKRFVGLARLATSLLLSCIFGCSDQHGAVSANSGAAGQGTAGVGGSGGTAGSSLVGGAGGLQAGGAGNAGAGGSLGGASGGVGAQAGGGAGGAPGAEGYQSVVTRTVPPSRFVNLGSGKYFIEFPKAAFGTLDIAITGAGSEAVTLKFGEKKAGDAVEANPGGDLAYKLETVTTEAGSKTYRVIQHPTLGFFARSDKLFPTIPFRYVEVSDCPGTLTAADVNQIAVNYPFDDDASSFGSNSSTLNDVWALCKYSTKATSWLGVYVDGNRERCPYEADAYIQMLSHYSQDTQAYAIGRASLIDLVQHPSWPAEWAFNLIYAAWADYMWSGDKAFLSASYATLKTKTLDQYARADGLINPTGTGISQDTPVVDWPYAYRDDYDVGSYPSSVNAQRYQALVLMAKIASALGNTSDAADYDAKASSVYSAFQTAYFDAGQGRYVDSIGSSHAALHASAYALASGIVPAESIASVAAYVKARGAVFGVYGAQYVIDGLYRADEEDYALSLLASTGKNSWQNMLASGSTITTEAFDPTFGDWSHAWGTAPANLIPRGLMGIEPLEPGFSKIQIKPQIGTLTSASIKLPTIRGPVSVSANKGSTYKLSVTVPRGATAKVYVKDYGSLGTTVTVDGSSTTGTLEGRYVVFDNVAAGSHTFEKALGPS